jgi:hypothetical protein
VGKFVPVMIPTVCRMFSWDIKKRYGVIAMDYPVRIRTSYLGLSGRICDVGSGGEHNFSAFTQMSDPEYTITGMCRVRCLGPFVHISERNDTPRAKTVRALGLLKSTKRQKKLEVYQW